MDVVEQIKSHLDSKFAALESKIVSRINGLEARMDGLEENTLNALNEIASEIEKSKQPLRAQPAHSVGSHAPLRQARVDKQDEENRQRFEEERKKIQARISADKAKLMEERRQEQLQRLETERLENERIQRELEIKREEERREAARKEAERLRRLEEEEREARRLEAIEKAKRKAREEQFQKKKKALMNTLFVAEEAPESNLFGGGLVPAKTDDIFSDSAIPPPAVPASKPPSGGALFEVPISRGMAVFDEEETTGTSVLGSLFEGGQPGGGNETSSMFEETAPQEQVEEVVIATPPESPALEEEEVQEDNDNEKEEEEESPEGELDDVNLADL